MRIHLLGSCQVFWQERPFSIPRRQTRALLYCLAARLEPASRDRLSFLFWPDTPDAMARRHLTRLLSSLRAALPRPDLLLIDEQRVALNPALVECDSRQLLAISAVSDPPTLRAAVALYRGPFMAGFSLPDAPEYEAWQRQFGRDLEGLYLAALERLTAHYAAEGDYPAAIDSARRFLQTDELAETMHRRLIGLYTAAGDRTAAQRQYEQCALMLERELGVSPLPETRAALQNQPRRRAAISLTVQPSLDLPLTGRDAVLAQLQEAQRRMPRGSLILLHGPPGMGKTRLLREFVLQQEEGSLALAGNSYPGSQALPYHPLLQALRTSFAHRDLWLDVPAVWLSEVLPLLPDLRNLVPDLPVPLPTAPAHAQARLFTALTHLLRALAANPPLLLCLDDLHWADQGTLDWLLFLAARPEQEPLLLLATCHTPTAPVLAAVRQALRRAGRLAEIELSELAAADVQHLLARLSAPPSTALVERIHHIAGGNPFFVLEIVRELQERGQIDDPPDDLPLPTTLREAILARASHLSPVAHQVLEAAAVLTPMLDEALLEYTSARSGTETSDALDELLAHQFLQIDRAASEGLAFPHSLIGLAIYQGLTPWRRKLLHGRAAAGLVRLRPHDDATLAGHYAEAAAWETAIGCYRRAADQAGQTAAHDTALTLVNRAIDLLHHLPRPNGDRLALLRQRLALQRMLVRLDAWQADAAEVLHLAIAASDDDARLDALEAQISLHVLKSDFDQIETTAAQALALAQKRSDHVAEARIRQTLGWHLADALGRSTEGLALLEEARRLAEAAGAADVLYQTLCNLAFVQRAEGHCQAARATALRALTLRTVGSRPYATGDAPQPAFADALRELGEANAYLGRWEEALHLLRPLLDLYQTLNDPWAYGAVLHNYGLYCASVGLLQEAVSSMRRLVALSEAVRLPMDSDYGIWHRSGLARALLAAGETSAAGELLDSLRTGKLAPGRPYLAWVRAEAEYRLATGDPAAALRVVLPAVHWWRLNASLHDVDVLLLWAEAALATGDTRAARSAVEETAERLAGSDMRRYHLRLYAADYAVTGNRAALAAAQAELEQQAAGFGDPQLRALFVAWAGRLNRRFSADTVAV